MSKSNKKDKAKQDSLLELRIYLYFREKVGFNFRKTIDEILKERHMIPGNDSFSDGQLRDKLNYLVEGGFLEKWRDADDYNRAHYWLPGYPEEEQVNEQSVFEFTIQQLLDAYTGRMDRLNKDLQMFTTSGTEHLKRFLTVSKDDEFYFFDDQEFEMISDLYHHYQEQCFTKITLDINREPKEYYVVQVRLWNDGFVLICIKPGEQGSALRYYKLLDILNLEKGSAFSTNMELLKNEITKEIIGLSNQQIKKLSQTT